MTLQWQVHERGRRFGELLRFATHPHWDLDEFGTLRHKEYNVEGLRVAEVVVRVVEGTRDVGGDKARRHGREAVAEDAVAWLSSTSSRRARVVPRSSPLTRLRA